MNITSSALAPVLWNALRIQILDNGLARLGREWNQAHSRPPFSRLYYIVDGQGAVECGGQRVKLLPGRAYLLPAGLSLRYECPEEMTQLYFHLSVRTPDGYDLFSRCGRLLEMTAEIPPARLCEDYLSGDYLPLSQLEYRVKADICRFIAAAGLEQQLLTPQSAFLSQVFSFVRRELRSSLTLAQIARALAISESALAKRFRREFGMTLGRYVDEMLTQEISRLLAGTDLTIGQIAERLGFCDQFYLARFFGARQGMPPRAYRAQARGRI